MPTGECGGDPVRGQFNIINFIRKNKQQGISGARNEQMMVTTWSTFTRMAAWAYSEGEI